MTIETPDKIDQKSAHRELVFENVAADKENLSLMIRDSLVGGKADGFYKIPLYQGKSRENNDNEADVELVHIFPKRYASSGEKILKHQDFLRDGYLYIFVDGYFWRELKVTAHAGSDGRYTIFNDVNLAYQKGELTWKASKGRREATGESLKSVIVPHKLKGKACRVEIAYAETQWAWWL